MESVFLGAEATNKLVTCLSCLRLFCSVDSHDYKIHPPEGSSKCLTIQLKMEFENIRKLSRNIPWKGTMVNIPDNKTIKMQQWVSWDALNDSRPMNY